MNSPNAVHSDKQPCSFRCPAHRHASNSYRHASDSYRHASDSHRHASDSYRHASNSYRHASYSLLHRINIALHRGVRYTTSRCEVHDIEVWGTRHRGVRYMTSRCELHDSLRRWLWPIFCCLPRIYTGFCVFVIVIDCFIVSLETGWMEGRDFREFQLETGLTSTHKSYGRLAPEDISECTRHRRCASPCRF